MPTTTPPDGTAETAAEEAAAAGPHGRLIESLFDNLSLWTVIAAAISFLYLIWVTLDVLSRYVNVIPKVGP